MKSKIKVLVIFVVLFLGTYVPEIYPKVFGDWWCSGIVRRGTESTFCQHTLGTQHSATWHWGWRHWIWCMAGLVFTIWTIVEVIESSSKNK